MCFYFVLNKAMTCTVYMNRTLSHYPPYMTIRRIFPNTTPVKDFESFRQRAINLYREWLREVIKRSKLTLLTLQIPRAVQKYPLDVSVAQGRSRIRHQFQQHSAYFSSLPETAKLAAMNAALLKGTQELIEVHNRWSQKTHVMRWFEGAGETLSPAILAMDSQKQVNAINENISKIQVTPFLANFLTK